MSRLVNILFIIIIRGYQLCLSPLWPNRCRFAPSCSQYSLVCFQRFSFYKALWYSGKRILKCQPFHRGGFDPVPQKGS